jgi:hypothetical protein
MVVTDPLDTTVPPVEWLAGYGASSAVSPDGNTLAVLTTGYNRVFQGAFPLFDPLYSNEYVFLYNIQSGVPVFEQTVTIPNSYHGIVWDPSSTAFYVSGGMGDAPFGTDPIPYTPPTTATMSTSSLSKETEPGRKPPNLTWAKIPHWVLSRATLRATAFLYSTAHSPR